MDFSIAGAVSLSSLILFAIAAHAGETTTFTYDALGRLVSTSSSGTVNNGLSNTIAYDPAGNRSSYGTSGAPGGTQPPPPPPANQPPVANPDSITSPKCVTRFVNVVANDTDPEGNYPLGLVSVNQPRAWVESGTTVGMFTPDVNGGYAITYTVADSLGATSTGTLSVNVTGSQQCN
ncbi:Ig-like domain-containing protein [Sandaracinobacteroides saxicola]|nr:Ig-like domain-containing protein [Sandaracinobacteroides saxicola]